jgi:hypothetical protein
MEEFKKPDYNESVPSLGNEFNATFDDVVEVYEYEKAGSIIEQELEEFRSSSSSEQKKHNEEVNEGGFSLDSLDSTEGEEGEGQGEEGEGEGEGEEERGELEDYFSSAEFIIWVLELALVWGTNIYLKNNNLDKIGLEEFEKTNREQKYLVKSFAKVLQKYNKKVSPEMELIFAVGSAYGMKIKGIVKRQEERKEEELKNKNKKGVTNAKKTPRKKQPAPPYKAEVVSKKDSKKSETFSLDVSGIEEVEEIVDDKEIKTADLIE